MDMRMKLKRPSPSVKDPEKAGCVSADVLLISCQLFQGLGRRFEHSAVGIALMTPNECPNLFRDGEGHHEMMSGQRLFQLPVHPFKGFLVLTRRTDFHGTGKSDDCLPSNYMIDVQTSLPVGK